MIGWVLALVVNLWTWRLCDCRVNVFWPAGHSGCRTRSRRSYSRSKRRVEPGPPLHSYVVCLYSSHLQRERGIIIWIIRQNAKTLSHTPSKGLQGMVLQERSCTGLESRSQAALCCLSAVRHRTSRVCIPSPQDREHWTDTEGKSVTAEEGRTDGWRDEVVLTVLHSVVNHCGLQGCSSHGCTGDGFSRCEHSLAALTVKSLPVFFTQMTSLRWVPFPHAVLHCSTESVQRQKVSLHSWGKAALCLLKIQCDGAWMPLHKRFIATFAV